MDFELQSRVTLDEALLRGYETFRNGCYFKLIRKADGRTRIASGCDLRPNLLTDDPKLIWNFIRSKTPLEKMGDQLNQEIWYSRRIDHLVKPETIHELLKREPCTRCGGALFEERK